MSGTLKQSITQAVCIFYIIFAKKGPQDHGTFEHAFSHSLMSGDKNSTRQLVIMSEI